MVFADEWGRVERIFLLNKLNGFYPCSSWVKQYQWHLLHFFLSGRKWPPWPVVFGGRHLVCSLHEPQGLVLWLVLDVRTTLSDQQKTL